MEPWEKALEALDENRNILITGGAGTGKSFTLGKIIDRLEEKNVNVARTAMTGMASLQLKGGETLHSCLGIGFSKCLDDLPHVIRSWKFRNQTLWELKVLDVLIIDEISMLRSDTLELIDAIFKYVKDSDEPFGGVQTIFSGDFMQLSPIVKPEEKAQFKSRGPWCFQSQVFSDLNFRTIYLTEIKRQESRKFAQCLNMIRTGTVNDRVDKYFFDAQSHEFPQGVEPVRLSSTNAQVFNINSARLKRLAGKLENHKAKIEAVSDKLKAKIIRDCPGVENLDLKVGAQVMIIVNGSGFVNGSMGEYLGITKKSDQDIGRTIEVAQVRLFNNDQVVLLKKHTWKIEKRETVGGETVSTVLASFCQFPLKLGWAITIHKSQGMSIDYLDVDLMSCFAEGMAYVALSRARKYEGLRITNWRPGIVTANKDAFNFYMKLKRKGEI